MEELLYNLLAIGVEKYPILTSIFLVIGVLRAINKPLFVFLRAYVLATPSTSDDAILDSVEKSQVYKAISFVLDWTTSIKLPAKQAAAIELPKGSNPVEPS